MPTIAVAPEKGNTQSRGFVVPAMRRSRFFGSTLILAGASLLATVSYEPANIANILGFGNTLSEGAVVILSLLVVIGCGIGGLAILRSASRSVRST